LDLDPAEPAYNKPVKTAQQGERLGVFTRRRMQIARHETNTRLDVNILEPERSLSREP